MSHESKEKVVNTIFENAEQRPWKLASAIWGKLPLVFMREKQMTREEALAATKVIVDSLGSIPDDANMETIKEKLLQAIEL